MQNNNQGYSLLWKIIRFSIIFASVLIFYFFHRQNINRFISNISEVTVGSVTIKTPVTGKTKIKIDDIKITSEFTVLETHVNRDKLKILEMQFVGDGLTEYIKIQAEDDVDLRFGFIADAKRFYGQSTSKPRKKDEEKLGAHAKHKHKAKELLLFEPFDKDLDLRKGDILTIYSMIHEKYENREERIKEIMEEAKDRKHKEVLIGELPKALREASSLERKYLENETKVINFLEKLKSDDEKKDKEDIEKLIKKLHEKKPILELEDEDGMWKSDFYEVDRVVIGNSDGEILIDFTYTLLPK